MRAVSLSKTVVGRSAVPFVPMRERAAFALRTKFRCHGGMIGPRRRRSTYFNHLCEEETETQECGKQQDEYCPMKPLEAWQRSEKAPKDNDYTAADEMFSGRKGVPGMIANVENRIDDLS